MEWISHIPKSYCSWLVGTLANIPLPRPLAKALIEWFIRAYKIDPKTATRPLEFYRSIGHFFTRDLKPELRPIGQGLLSPVDGTLRSVHDVGVSGAIPQVKGKTYSLSSLLAGDPFSERLSRGQVWNFYLSPQDAHHIFSPVDGTIVKTVHIPGKLWPVNDWALHSVDGLFAVNERVVTYIESSIGLVAVVMVGATNVGKISLSYANVETNEAPWKRHVVRTIDHSPPIAKKRGDKLGTFKMGSSVIVVLERSPLLAAKALAPSKTTYGTPLLTLCRGS